MNVLKPLFRFSLSALLCARCAQHAPVPVPFTTPASFEAAPTTSACPADVPANTRCLAGKDSTGAHYLIAMPEKWNKMLVLHAHGGPALGVSRATRVEADLTRWTAMVKAGYAWAGSSFSGGVAVRAAAEDTERVRRIFVTHVAQPRRTILHGQSWGAGVAAVGAEMFAHAANGRAAGLVRTRRKTNACEHRRALPVV